MEAGEEHFGVLATKLNALPAARWDPVLSPEVNLPREVAHMCPAAEASGEDPDALFITFWKPVALPGAKFPRKTQETSVSSGALGT